ncbi:MAG: hypothetical protein ABIH39_09075 [Candidatus Margulisiibacteriota bacterium]
MRINAVGIGINRSYYNPARWVPVFARPTGSEQTDNIQNGQHKVNHMVNEQLFRPELTTPYQTTTTTEPGKAALAVANFSPANMDLWKQIKKTFGIEMIDTIEARFNREELKIVFNTLAEVARRNPSHLIGIDSIVKSFSLGLSLELMHAKANGKTVFGAYQKDQRRIYLFESCPLGNIRETLLHEIGHAVHSYNVSTKTIMKNIRKLGWTLQEYKQTFLANNTYYPIVLQACPADAHTWQQAYMAFTESMLKKKRTPDGRFVLEAPMRYKGRPEFANPLETFACLYERLYRR